MSLKHFAEVKRLAPLDASSYAATGLIELHQGKLENAITSLHHVRKLTIVLDLCLDTNSSQALALAPGDTLAGDLLTKALNEAAQVNHNIGPPEEEVDLLVDQLLYANESKFDNDTEEEEDMDYE